MCTYLDGKGILFREVEKIETTESFRRDQGQNWIGSKEREHQEEGGIEAHFEEDPKDLRQTSLMDHHPSHGEGELR